MASGAKTGAVTLIQRFGSALKLFLDGAYTFGGQRVSFHRARPPKVRNPLAVHVYPRDGQCEKRKKVVSHLIPSDLQVSTSREPAGQGQKFMILQLQRLSDHGPPAAS